MTMTYRHRNGAVTAADAWYLMNLDGTLATPGPMMVPTGMNRITQVIFGLGDIAPTAAGGNLGFMLKLSGVADGEALIVLGAQTTSYKTAGNSGAPRGMTRYDVDIPVKAGAQISPYVCATAGTDSSSPQADITLGFST